VVAVVVILLTFLYFFCVIVMRFIIMVSHVLEMFSGAVLAAPSLYREVEMETVDRVEVVNDCCVQ